MKKPLLVAIVLLLIGVAMIGRRWWWKSTDEVAALAAGPPPAALIPDSTTVVLSGRIGAGGTEPVLAKKPGRIRSIYFDAGKYVRRGTIIAKLADYNFVIAPHDGFLGERQIALGEYVKPGTVVTSITKRGCLLLPVAVPAGSPARVQPGDSVRVWATSRPTRVVTGVVAPAKDTTGGITLEIQLASRAPLHLGEAASVQLKR
ncbi:HlyD family secretion protein [Microvirga sp. STS02]|uniref:HlyD family efflux transporter periplasmic adaptor subunit n=1 Tax=Hymenobacter negativus TaxID=2795026 RepID=UPI0018DE051D|nr:MULTISPECIES: HlyD family efflux transporter periplasmic adaptor subunit [Bacteria]MBH8567564.1 HlyD family secretion protein [Hymenobacter negativus]MBR7207296.1 HlyD family secretion protein [Microvirga sp. STS02]